MESKRMVMFVTMMIVGNLLIQTEAEAPPQAPSNHESSGFRKCYPVCIVACVYQKNFPDSLTCPISCLLTCIAPKFPALPKGPWSPSGPWSASEMDSTNKINHNDYYCKLGCATRHCVSLSSIQNPNVDKVADCVDSCSDKCVTKN